MVVNIYIWKRKPSEAYMTKIYRIINEKVSSKNFYNL